MTPFAILFPPPVWTDLDEHRLRQAIRNHMPRKHLQAKKQAAINYELWRSLPWWKRLFRRPKL